LEELSPNKTAYELFGHLQPGDKIAITTRFNYPKYTQQYVDALESRGLVVRLVTNQTAFQDFCFLTQAQKELVGMVRSTFLVWAGLLGRAQRVRMYSVESPMTIRVSKQKNRTIFRSHKWINPILQSKISFELHTSEDMDELRRKRRERIRLEKLQAASEQRQATTRLETKGV
jgi:hypothetical protein